MPSSREPALMDVAVRKEAFDLLVAAWPDMSEAKRERIVQVILNTPAEPLLRQNFGAVQVHSDYRVFVRLSLIERIGQPGLPEAGRIALQRIRAAHPEWASDEGERAHFGSWLSAGSGSWVDEFVHPGFSLETRTAEDIAGLLASVDDRRQALLRDWEHLWHNNFGRTSAVLDRIAVMGLDRPDVWAAAIRGCRMARSGEVGRLIPILARLPGEVLSSADVAAEGSGLLAASMQGTGEAVTVASPAFWALWDRFLPVVAAAPVPSGAEELLVRARMCGGGSLATALLQALAAAKPRARQGLGGEFLPRFERLRDDGDGLRMARVLLARDLFFLHAVDPDWTRAALIPLMDWDTSPEAAALWEGYASGLRIGPELWADLKAAYLQLVTGGHLGEFGATRRNLVCVPVVLGVHSPGAEADQDLFPKLMGLFTPDDLAEVAKWIWRFTLQSTQTGNSEGAIRNDRFMADRALPWLKQTWPRSLTGRSSRASLFLAEAALNTRNVFPAIVAALRSLLGKIEQPDAFLFAVGQSPHAADHPRALLELLDATADPNGVGYGPTLKQILDRMRAADSTIDASPIFGRWWQRARQLTVLHPG